MRLTADDEDRRAHAVGLHMEDPLSTEQRRTRDALMRAAPLDIGGTVAEQRVVMETMLTSILLADDVTTTPATLGGVPVLHVDVAGTDASRVLLYLHGGAHALGSVRMEAGLAADVARHAGTRVVSVDYGVAPEDPFPAALDDAIAGYRALLAQCKIPKLVRRSQA